MKHLRISHNAIPLQASEIEYLCRGGQGSWELEYLISKRVFTTLYRMSISFVALRPPLLLVRPLCALSCFSFDGNLHSTVLVKFQGSRKKSTSTGDQPPYSKPQRQNESSTEVRLSVRYSDYLTAMCLVAIFEARGLDICTHFTDLGFQCCPVKKFVS